MQESRRLNRRLAELTDIVEELLVPLAQRDEDKVNELPRALLVLPVTRGTTRLRRNHGAARLLPHRSAEDRHHVPPDHDVAQPRPSSRSRATSTPATKRMDHYHASQAVRGSAAPVPGEARTAWDRLVRQLARVGRRRDRQPRVLQPGHGRPGPDAVEALGTAEVSVVVTARDYVRQFPAVWQEALKMNSDLSLDEFMKRAFAARAAGRRGAGAARTSRRCSPGGRQPSRQSGSTSSRCPRRARRAPCSGSAGARCCELDDSTFDMDLSLRQRVAGCRPGGVAAPAQAVPRRNPSWTVPRGTVG